MNARHEKITPRDRLGFELEHLFSRRTRLRPFEMIGPTPDGLRVNVYTLGGEVFGPALNGRTLPVGSDWFTLRRDGVGLIDSRVTIETETGSLVYVAYTGIADLGPDAYERALRGEPTGRAALHTSVRFWTADPRYAGLNRIVAVGIGENRPDESGNVWDVYALRAGARCSTTISGQAE